MGYRQAVTVLLTVSIGFELAKLNENRQLITQCEGLLPAIYLVKTGSTARFYFLPILLPISHFSLLTPRDSGCTTVQTPG